MFITQDLSISEVLKKAEIIKSNKKQDGRFKVVGSRSHMNEETVNFVEKLKKQHKKIDIISKGSSLKFCLVAEGEADVYPRFAPTMEWDTAAAHAVCKASGVKVYSEETGEELIYNKENLLNSWFVCER